MMKLNPPRPEKFAVGTKVAFVPLRSETVPLVALVRLNVAPAANPETNCARFKSTAGAGRARAGACGAAAERLHLAQDERIHFIARQRARRREAVTPRERGRHRRDDGSPRGERRGQDGAAALVARQRNSDAAAEHAILVGVVKVAREIHALIVVYLIPRKVAAAA